LRYWRLVEKKAQKRKILKAQKKRLKNAPRTSRPVHALLDNHLER
jgi:hypothetical protein